MKNAMCQYFLQSTYSQIKIINLQKTIAFFVFLWYHNLRWVYAGVLELADEVDSKSIGSNTVRVRPPPPAPKYRCNFDEITVVFFYVP